MTRQLIPFLAAAAGLLALSACETAPQETITWNAPRQGTVQTTPSPPLTTSKATSKATPQAAAPSEPQCREYQTTVTIGGKPEKAYGRACRQPDGTWKQVGNLSTTPPAAPSGEQMYPYGWYGYDFPEGPRYYPGTSVGVGVGTGSGGTGGFIGYGVGF